MEFRLSAIRVENAFVSRKALAAGRGKQPAASALRLTRHRNQHKWRRAGKIHVPLDWKFVPSRLLMEPAGRTFLKLIQSAIAELLTD